MKPGNTVEVSIEGIGVLRNIVVARHKGYLTAPDLSEIKNVMLHICCAFLFPPFLTSENT